MLPLCNALRLCLTGGVHATIDPHGSFDIHGSCDIHGGFDMLSTMSTTAPVQTPRTAEPDTEQIPETGEPVVAHIVKTEPGENAAAKVLEARITGTPLEALCGHVWVPSRDPRQVPMCQKCKDIYDTYRMFNDGLGQTPRD